MEKTFNIEGMTCGGCANTVKTKFSAIAGVQSVEVDLDNKTATVVSNDNIAQADLVSALEDTNYTLVGEA